MHFTGYLKNRTLADRERNYLEFVFKRAFKFLLVRKNLWRELVSLEQGKGHELDFFNVVHMKIYKSPTIKFSKITLIGSIYNTSKDIHYLFKLIKHNHNKFYLEVELVSHIYKSCNHKYYYINTDTKSIYFIFEKDELIWS